MQQANTQRAGTIERRTDMGASLYHAPWERVNDRMVLVSPLPGE
jgi:hypothetical protein